MINGFLKTRKEVDDCTKYLIDNDLICSGLSCKNFDIANVVPLLVEGNILDMGSDGSEILNNAVKLKLKGRKVGIDLTYSNDTITSDGIQKIKGDLMYCPFPDYLFDIVTCLSVLEHQVSFDKISKECGRLLKKDGKLFISFDYWPEKINTEGILLYGLTWNILSKSDVLNLIQNFHRNGLELTSEIDWTIQDAVINDKYCSPAKNISYTFGILEFIKK